MEAEEEGASPRWEDRQEKSLAATEEDSPEIVLNMTLDWKDCVELNHHGYGTAMICFMALTSLFIVLLLKANKYVRKVTEVRLS